LKAGFLISTPLGQVRAATTHYVNKITRDFPVGVPVLEILGPPWHAEALLTDRRSDFSAEKPGTAN
jgi:hypothetical protein